MDQLPTTTVTDLADDALVLDVREPEEWAAGHAPGAIHIPMGDIPARLDEVPPTEDTLPVICRSGGRSERVVQWLLQQGYDVANVTGGMRAWSASGKAMASESGEEPHVV